MKLAVTSRSPSRPRIPGPISSIAVLLLILTTGCGRSVPPKNRPDDVLRQQLGLADTDEVHRVTLTGGKRELLDPMQTILPQGAWVEFVTGDGRIHEVGFVADSLSPEARAFLQRTDQMDSPPLVNKGQRFVISFRDAPPGRYPFRVRGNERPGYGVVVVRPKH